MAKYRTYMPEPQQQIIQRQLYFPPEKYIGHNNFSKWEIA